MDTESTGKTDVMQVDNISFLLERLAGDCDDLQFLRELTMNSIEAIQRSGRQTGEIIWDVDPSTERLTGTPKLSIVDTGTGMTGSEMVRHINHLSSSSSAQSLQGNFGVGAKISAATRNPLGVLYLSWKEGKGSMVRLWRNPDTHEYGLLQQTVERADGELDYGSWAPVDDAFKPSQIDDSGTKVILLGKTAEQDTMVAPDGTRHRWITRYLNSRFYRFPDGITVKSREGLGSEGKDCDRLRTITGSQHFLDKWAKAQGRVDLDSATAHWWILSPKYKTHGLYSGGGHVAALYKDELYELKSGRAGSSLLQMFGIYEEHYRVVIYLEPLTKEESVTTNTARTQLMIGQEPLPWADWAAQFRERIPEELVALMESSSRDNCDFDKTIRDRLKSLDDLYRIKKYKPKKSGTKSIDEDATTCGASVINNGSECASNGDKPKRNSLGVSSRRVNGDIYSLFVKKEAAPAEEVDDKLDINVRWVAENDLGGADRAANYVVETNTLLINREFRVFEHFIERWVSRYQHIKSARQVVTDVSREWFQQLLVELVYSVEFLRGDREWTENDIRMMLSDEALTAAVLPRYHTEKEVKRSLALRLGSLRFQPEPSSHN